MTKKCPKCGYIRLPSDSSPEWQCPSCGVAYEKVSHNNSANHHSSAHQPHDYHKNTHAPHHHASHLADISHLSLPEGSSNFEKFLFSFTRVFSIIGALIAIVLIALLAMSLKSDDKIDRHISYQDIRPAHSSTSQSSSNKDPVLDFYFALDLPDNIRKHIDDGNEDVFVGWVDDLDEDDRDDFIENLSSIIDEAESNNEEDILDVINKYKSKKLRKIDIANSSSIEEKATKGAAIAGIIGLMVFVSLLSLILVMLAVERNTRHLKK